MRVLVGKGLQAIQTNRNVRVPKGQNKHTETVPENDTFDSAAPAISDYVAILIHPSLETGREGWETSITEGWGPQRPFWIRLQ